MQRSNGADEFTRTTVRWVAAVIAVACTLVLGSSAARASGVESTKISLPKGPASIEGLGRNFEPSLASGTASYGIEIAVPPAVGGFGPKLSLDYDSGGGVSELGMGWRLSGVPRIRRRVDEGLPRFDETDAFEVAGIGLPSDLLEVAPGVFRPEHESGAFLRVTRGRDGGTWEARVKNGFTYRFGGEGYVEAEDGQAVTYLLREQHDLHGHVIRYEWDTADGHALLTSVTWNDFSEATRIQVVFDYEERPDVYERFSSGIRQVIARRLKTIDVTYGGELVRRYTLGYEEGTHSRLADVTMVGTDGVTAMPTLRFRYTEPRFAADGPITTMRSAPGRSPEETDVELADLNGDSLPDLLVTEPGAYRSYLNHDGVSWRPAEAWSASNSPSLALSSTGVQLADVDGDGAIDFLAKSGTTSFRFFPGLAATRFAAPVSIATVPNFTFEDPDVRLADMDGDRRTDVVITTEAGLAIGYNLRGTDWALPESIGVVDETQALRFSDGHTQLCDVNGDRVHDLCYLRSESLVYWLGRGRGVFEPARRGSGVPPWDASSPWQLHDLDGDGWVDLVHVGVHQVSYALATAAGRFGEVRHVRGVPTHGPDVSVTFADMNGSGTTDIVWIDPTATANTAWRYLELFPNGRAGLLEQIDNGLGKITRIHYEPAAQNAARARDAGAPWTTRMNVGMPVVSRVEIDASLGDPLLAVEYRYHDGTWDPKERTFAGFGRGIQTELGDEYTPTLLTESTFDTGLLHRVLRGAVLTSEQRDQHGLIFTRTISSYTPRVLATALDGRAVHYAYKSAERVENIEGTDSSTARTTLTEWTQDDYGNVTRESRWGEIIGDDKLAGDDEAITLRTYANNTDDWLLGYLATEELQDTDGNRVALKRHYYDGPAFRGLPLGEVTRGSPSRVESWIAEDTFADEEASEFDEHGNQIAMITARGGRQEYEYDPESHNHLTTERRHVDGRTVLVWHSDYDARFGVLTSFEMPNGQQHSFGYDALGRLISVVKPGDTEELPTLRYRYEVTAPLPRVIAEQREVSGERGVLTTQALSDGLGRSRGVLQEAENGGWVLQGRVAFDARGQVVFKAFASFERKAELPEGVAPQGVWLRRDALGRETATEHVDGSSTRVSYGPLSRQVWDENDNDSSSKHHDTPTRYESDGAGRLRRVIEREGSEEHTTEYHYDPAGNLRRLRDANGTVRSYAYDGRGRRTRIEDPNAGTWRFTYTAGNDLEQRFDPAGHHVRYAYDHLGRVTGEWHQKRGDSREQQITTYHYDHASADHPEFAPNLLGNLAWVEDAGGQLFFGYDARNRETTRIRRWSDGQEHHLVSEFDSADRQVARFFPDGSFYRSRYNERGLRASVGPFVSDMQWTADAQLASMRLGDVVTDGREYDERHRLVRLATTGAPGAPLRDLRYTLDAASRITAVDDLRPGIPAAERLSASFVFDDRYRLRQLGAGSGDLEWDYDDVGKIVAVRSRYEDPSLHVINRYGEDGAGPDQLTHHGTEKLTYDAAGRLLADGSRQLTWDAKGRLTRVERGGLIEEYVYGFDDTRLIKQSTENGSTRVVRYIGNDAEQREGQLVRYVFAGDQRVARLDPVPEGSTPSVVVTPPATRSNPTGALTAALVTALLALLGLLLRPSRNCTRARWAVLLGAPLAVSLACGPGADARHPNELTTVPDTTVFYLSDINGSPLQSVDAQGNLLSSLSYHPYGLVRSAEGEANDPHRFVGNEHDRGADLGDFKARPYRADAALFLAPDPVATFSPEEALETPARLFTYAYAGGDPINRADPSGEDFGDYVRGIVDEGVATATAAAKSTFELARTQFGALAEGRVGDYLETNFEVGASMVTAPIELARNVARFGDDFAEAVFAGSDYERGRKAVKPIQTAMALTAAVAGARLPGKQCFTGDTLVTTAEGLRPIDQIEVGDLVLARDPMTGAYAYQPVTEVFVTSDAAIVEVLAEADDGTVETLRATPGHLFWVEGRGWTEAGELSAGDVLASADGQAATVGIVRPLAATATVYNLEVAEFHTYHVGSRASWVHNGCSGKQPPTSAAAADSGGALEAMSKAAGAADRGGLTQAGRALQKHGNRPGSAFPRARGTPEQINHAGQMVVDDILTSPGATTTTRHHARFGEVTETRAPDGRGVRFSADGSFIGFLEP